jgi:hypothetical protein
MQIVTHHAHTNRWGSEGKTVGTITFQIQCSNPELMQVDLTAHHYVLQLRVVTVYCIYPLTFLHELKSSPNKSGLLGHRVLRLWTFCT